MSRMGSCPGSETVRPHSADDRRRIAEAASEIGEALNVAEARHKLSIAEMLGILNEKMAHWIRCSDELDRTETPALPLTVSASSTVSVQTAEVPMTGRISTQTGTLSVSGIPEDDDRTMCICDDVDDHGYVNLLKYCLVHGGVGKLIVSSPVSQSACTCVELSKKNAICPKHRVVFPRPAEVRGVPIELVAIKNREGY